MILYDWIWIRPFSLLKWHLLCITLNSNYVWKVLFFSAPTAWLCKSSHLDPVPHISMWMCDHLWQTDLLKSHLKCHYHQKSSRSAQILGVYFVCLWHKWLMRQEILEWLRVEIFSVIWTHFYSAASGGVHHKFATSLSMLLCLFRSTSGGNSQTWIM